MPIDRVYNHIKAVLRMIIISIIYFLAPLYFINSKDLGEAFNFACCVILSHHHEIFVKHFYKV